MPLVFLLNILVFVLFFCKILYSKIFCFKSKDLLLSKYDDALINLIIDKRIKNELILLIILIFSENFF
jgi:hypothetical protein